MWWAPCHLPELTLMARLQTGAWVCLSHEGRVWGTGEWASAPHPGCCHCGLSHRLVATALGAASLHPSLPPLGEEETEAQGANDLPTVTHMGPGARVLSHARLPATPLACPCAHSDRTVRRFPMWDPGLPPHRPWEGGLQPQLLFPVPHGGHPGEAPWSWAFHRDGGCER